MTPSAPSIVPSATTRGSCCWVTGEFASTAWTGRWRALSTGVGAPSSAPVRPGDPDLAVRLFRSDRSGLAGSSAAWRALPHRALGAPGRRLALIAYHFAVCRDSRRRRAGASRSAAVPPSPRNGWSRTRSATWWRARRWKRVASACTPPACFTTGRPGSSPVRPARGRPPPFRLCAPALSLGDDFGLVFPGDGGWVAPALPFDNAERIDHDPPRGWFPVARILAAASRPTRPGRAAAGGIGAASLMGSAAFPWALPEQSEATCSIMCAASSRTADSPCSTSPWMPTCGQSCSPRSADDGRLSRNLGSCGRLARGSAAGPTRHRHGRHPRQRAGRPPGGLPGILPRLKRESPAVRGRLVGVAGNLAALRNRRVSSMPI